MNKPITARPVDTPRVSIPERASAERAMTKPAPGRKPTGPVIYRIENGADVWPGRK